MRYFLLFLLVFHPSIALPLDSTLLNQLRKRPWAREEILEHVRACGEGVVQGQSGPNRCSYTVPVDSWLLKSPKEKTGLVHDPAWPYRAGVEYYQPDDSISLPESFDLRDYMQNGVPEIKQQKCADCWAWSAHHALEIARAVNDATVLDLSVQTVLSCSGSGSCAGGNMSSPQFLVNRGLPLENMFPYSGRDLRCKFTTTSLASGWEGKVFSAPYVGSSRTFSRATYSPSSTATAAVDPGKVEMMMRAMYQFRAPLVVTVYSYSAGAGVVDSCSAINSQGNHMVALVGWSTVNGKRVAHVWNSWGPSHGEKGVSRIVWECGAGRLNRGLGVLARVVQYQDPADSNLCDMPTAFAGNPTYKIRKGETVVLGAPAHLNQKCTWSPSEGLSSPNSCITNATPEKTTEYHVQATNTCGTTSAMTLVEVRAEPF